MVLKSNLELVQGLSYNLEIVTFLVTLEKIRVSGCYMSQCYVSNEYDPGIELQTGI